MNAFLRTCLVTLACLAAFGCAVQKTQRDRDIEQCTYGVVVPDNISQREREAYIQHEAVPACLRAKGYTDAEGAR
ncbi:hypothetical protein HBF26_17115 [Luteibacter jiangsuensis]|uniref:Lipoprotein n=1 Tax=Luteibacter jiangsuensis TaxID=637577 RepID=A0ABX0Q8B3_9GAMM|nr:hypothetical protein [Luteibacter jiangsuensis]NID06618.1 hypothetical protein [Luteibacter jiangsuensis]